MKWLRIALTVAMLSLYGAVFAVDVKQGLPDHLQPKIVDPSIPWLGKKRELGRMTPETIQNLESMRIFETGRDQFRRVK